MARRVRLFPTMDGRLRSASDSYATARNGGAAVDQVDTAGEFMYVGQNKAATSPLYRLHQGFVEFDFDTVGAVVPADATVEAVTLKATPMGLSTGGADFTIEASVFDFGASLEAADWRSSSQLAALTRVATKATAGLAVDVGFEFDDLALVDAVQAALAGRKLRLVLASNRMRTATTPSGMEYVTLYSTEGSSIWNAMQLEVTYTPAYEHTARLELTYGTLDLNDGTTWRLRPGFAPGAEEKSYDEHLSYTGNVAQYNVTEAHLIEMYVPLILEGASLDALKSSVDALNALIDAGEQTLTFEGTAYSCASCPRIALEYDATLLATFCAFIDWKPLRYPGEAQVS